MKKIISFLLICVMMLSSVGMSAVATSTKMEGSYTQPEKFIYGDVDMDSVVTVKDATLVQKGVAGITYVTAVQRFLADPAGEGFNVKNATAIQKYLAGHETESMIGEELDMSSQDEFSSKMGSFDEYTRMDRIVVTVKNPQMEYTLEDFPEYDFKDIKVNHYEFDGFFDVKECYLYLSNLGEETVAEAIRALDYRANVDLKNVSLYSIRLPC